MQIKKEWTTMMGIALMMFVIVGAAYAIRTDSSPAGEDRSGVVNLSGHLVQEKIFLHGNGQDLTGLGVEQNGLYAGRAKINPQVHRVSSSGHFLTV